MIKSKVVKIKEDSLAINAWYIELIGNTWSFCLNYERTIDIFPTLLSNHTCLISRIGFGIGVWPFHYAAPMMLSITFGEYYRIELGAGFFIDYVKSEWLEGSSYPPELIKWTFTIGARFQEQNGGFVLRVGFTPVFSSHRYFPLYGISLGSAW